MWFLNPIVAPTNRMHPLAPIAPLPTSSRTPRWSCARRRTFISPAIKSARCLGCLSIKLEFNTTKGREHSATVATMMRRKQPRFCRKRLGNRSGYSSCADEHGWDNYGPAHLAEVRAGIDADGNIVAYEYHGTQHIWARTETSEQLALGTPAQENETSPGPGRPLGAAQTVTPFTLGVMYGIPNMRLVNHRVPGQGYLKGQSLRSPLDVSFSFASEQAIDELAHLADLDPFLFRQRNIKDPRWLGVLNAVANAARWTPRKSASNLSAAKVVKGRGIALGTHLTSYGAAVAEMEVDKESGRIVAKHMYGALDVGLAVN